MGEAAKLVVGGGDHVFTIVLALVSLLLQLFIPYRRYASVLKWLTLVLLTYVALVFMVEVDWGAAAKGFVVPSVSGESITTVVAILGTTISPYLFFWQSAQEVEEVDQDDRAKPLNEAPEQAKPELRRIGIDTFGGMAVSNIIAIAIMLGTAATLHASGKSDIATAADAAKALEPVAGKLAFPRLQPCHRRHGPACGAVLAGSAAYAIGESRGWKCGLEYKPWEAKAFYAVIAAATLIGVGIEWSPIDPMKALFWSAVINGVVAVPIMAAMMVIASRKTEMGRFTASPGLLIFGWAATAVMSAAVIAMFVI